MKFGDYVEIEQKRYGVENEMYIHKVVGYLKSNTDVDGPVESPKVEKLHSETVDVGACITCGVIGKDVLKYRISDVKEEKPVEGGLRGFVNYLNRVGSN